MLLASHRWRPDALLQRCQSPIVLALLLSILLLSTSSLFTFASSAISSSSSSSSFASYHQSRDAHLANPLRTSSASSASSSSLSSSPSSSLSYSFQPSPWSDCSLSCGGGISTRTIPCIGSDGQPASSSAPCLAEGLKPPSTQRKCNLHPCESYTWQVGEYSVCDAVCGGGQQTRKVRCRSSTSGSSKDFIDEKHCSSTGQDKPESTRVCNTQKCTQKQWRISEWDSCDRSCGTGEQTREVGCYGSDGTSYTDDDCLASYLARNSSLTKATNKKPSTKQACNTHICNSFFWQVESWQQCLVKCGGGIQKREVRCLSSEGKEQHDSLCATLAPKPESQRTCANDPCASYKLTASPWDSCSVSCGGGVQNRTVSCVSSRGVHITEPARMAELCPSPPDLERECNTASCASSDEKGWVVKGWSKCSTSCGGGVQQRIVKCVSKVDPQCKTFDVQPIDVRACATHTCPVYEWHTDEWSECSRSCGNDGVQRRELSCRGSDGSLHNKHSLCAAAGAPPSTTRPCPQQPQCVSYAWIGSRWSTCSKSCEGGTQTRDVACIGSDGKSRTADVCLTQGKKPDATKECNTSPCEKHEFVVSDWESCSVGCGFGIQTRTVQCRSTTTHKLVEVEKCRVKGEEIPSSERSCNTSPCVSYFWSLSEFNECSNSCNGGYQTRSVTCLGSDGVKYPDSYCLTLENKAPTQQVCNSHKCGNFSWAPEPLWSSCTNSCDGGVQTRAIRCIGPDGNTWDKKTCLNSSLALGFPPNDQVQTCNQQPCTTTSWAISPWSKCTKHCGSGKQTRDVTCRTSEGIRIPDRVCMRLSDKPVESQVCNSHSCPIYQWVTDEWDDCTTSCGGGIQSREVRCENSIGSRASNKHCYRLGLERPTVSQTCNTDACLPGASSWNVDPWQTCSHECGGGIRIRSVTCHPGQNATDKTCAALTKPAVGEPCNTHPCLSYKYDPTPWSICSKSCEDTASAAARNVSETPAVQTRQMRCLASDGSYTSLMRCAQYLNTTSGNTTSSSSSSSLPAISRPCKPSLTQCPKFKWAYGAWTECTKSCGEQGQQHRQVYCISSSQAGGDDSTAIKVKNSLCLFSGSKPYTSRRCNSYPCVRDYTWRIGKWQQCSLPCIRPDAKALNTQKRSVQCVDRFGSPVTKQACELTVGVEPVAERDCQKQAKCPQWYIGAWTKCSKNCGAGVQTREVRCATADGVVQKDANCAYAGPRQDDSRECNPTPCSAFERKYSAWNDCTRACNTGIQTRTQECWNNQLGKAADDVESCSHIALKPLSRSCNSQKCLTHQWKSSAWSLCSKECDGGVKTRDVVCQASNGETVNDMVCLSDAALSLLPKPDTKKECHTKPCTNDQLYTWKITSEWTKCSASCGGGSQTRDVVCTRKQTGEVVPDITCQSTPPQRQRTCATQDCITFHYIAVTEWSKCTKPCGGGETHRKVECVDQQGQVVAETACASLPGLNRLESTKACNTFNCNVLDSLIEPDDQSGGGAGGSGGAGGAGGAGGIGGRKKKKRKPKPPPRDSLYKARGRRTKDQSIGSGSPKEDPNVAKSPPKPPTHLELAPISAEDRKAIEDVIDNTRSVELRAKMSTAVPDILRYNDLDSKYDKLTAEGNKRTPSEISARKALRKAVEHSRARPGMSLLEDRQERYDQYDIQGHPRSLVQITQRKLDRARATAEKIAEALERAKSEIQAHPLDDETQQQQRSLAQLAQQAQHQVDVANAIASQVSAKVSEEGKDVNSPVVMGTGELPTYNRDGSCSDYRGCVMGAMGDDSIISPREAIEMLPVVPTFKEKEIDEYEG